MSRRPNQHRPVLSPTSPRPAPLRSLSSIAGAFLFTALFAAVLTGPSAAAYRPAGVETEPVPDIETEAALGITPEVPALEPEGAFPGIEGEDSRPSASVRHGRNRSDRDTIDIQRDVSDTLMTLRIDGAELHVPYFASTPLEMPHPSVTRAVISLHGTLRNGRTYLRTVTDAAAGVPGADSTAYLIAPQYLTEADVRADTLPDSYLFWAYMGWRQGDLSLSTLAHPRPAIISSFAVLDTLLQRLADANPNLETIVVSGHSAGGQFVNRYAAGTPMHEALAARGIALRYVVANPSAYLYFDEARWVPGTDSEHAVPPQEQIEACPGYNRFKYGLEKPNAYMDQGDEQLRQQYAARPVDYLTGGDDNDPNNTYLERNCEAMLQGEQRLQRALIYRGHLARVFGPEILDRHFFAVVPGVAHDGYGMFTSACGVFTLFGYGGCDAGLPVPSWDDRTTFALRAGKGHSVAWGDHDGDGRPDLVLAAPDSTDKLLRNDPDGTFRDVSAPPLIDPTNGVSATWVDIDDDGFLDIYALNWRGANRYLRNDGQGAFTDETSGLLGSVGDMFDGAWADYDCDGDLDVYLARAGGDLLLRNDGAAFTDVTPLVPQDSLNSRDAAWGDYDGDGDLDLYIANDNRANRLFRNDRIRFTDVTHPPLNVNGPAASACWADYDNDADLDLLLATSATRTWLFRNDGGVFSDATPPAFTTAGQARSASWGDYDNDGRPDVYLTCNRSRSRLFHNNGDGTFTDTATWPINDIGYGTGAAWADYDGDGALDLYLANDANWNKLFHNQGTPGNHWLQVDLRGVESNSHGVGARLRLVAGNVAQTREVGCETGSASQNSPTVHFGLGAAATVDALEVHWPSGIVQILTPGFAADRRIVVTESEDPSSVPESLTGEPRPGSGEARADGGEVLRVAAPLPNPFSDGTVIDFSLSRPVRVEARVYDAAGREVATLAAGSRFAEGRHQLFWSGRDAAGHRLPAGVYLCRINTDGAEAGARIVHLR